MGKLKPCPLCGGSAELRVCRDYTEIDFYVQCLGCGVSSRYSNSKNDVIEAWNRRMENENTKSCNDEYKS